MSMDSPLIKLIQTDTKNDLDEAWMIAQEGSFGLRIAVLLARVAANIARESSIRLADVLERPNYELAMKFDGTQWTSPDE